MSSGRIELWRHDGVPRGRGWGEVAKAEQPGFGETVGNGVGLGVAAVALNSGDDGNDGAERFAVRNNAIQRPEGRQPRVRAHQPRARRLDLSQCGQHIQPYPGRRGDGQYGQHRRSLDGRTGRDHRERQLPYPRRSGPPRFDNNEEFSPQDLRSDRKAGLDGYLGTPAGFINLRDLETENVRVIGRVTN